MKKELTAGFDAHVKGTLRLASFVALVVVAVPIYSLAKAVKKDAVRMMPRFFHVILVKILGIRVRVHGSVYRNNPTLFVSNHSSYLDVPVLGSLIHGSFVAKAEVADWPVFGILARLQDTAFIERKVLHSRVQRDVLRERLAAGDNLVLFPEGTSSDGHRTLPFKSSLFSAVEEGQAVCIQPVSIVCTQIGGLPMGRHWRPYYAWYGEMTLVGHVWDVFKIGSFTVDVVFHSPVTYAEFKDRKALALYCQRAVSSGVNDAVKGRPLLAKK